MMIGESRGKSVSNYLAALGAVAAMLLVRALLSPLFGTARPYTTLYAAIAFAVWFSRWRPAALAAIAGFLAANYFFVGPRNIFTGDSLPAVDFALYALSTGMIIFLGESMHRVTDRAAKERGEILRAEQRAQAQLAAIVEYSGDAIATKNLQGTVLTWNASAERLFGWPAEEIIGKPITLLLPPDRLHEEASILERLRDGKRVERFETIRVTRDGRQIPVSVSVSPMRDTDGRVIGASKVVHDISETVKAREAAAQEHQEARRAEKEIERLLTNERKARAEVERTNRMKDEFLATLSHELRTPLNAILGFSQLIEKKPGDVNAVIEGVQVITRNAKMQVDLISDLLDMSRIVSGKLRLDVKEVNLADVINAGLDAIRHSAQSRGIVIETSFPREALLARGDEGRLQQVVWNLLSNAVKFTPRRGRIRVSLKSDNGNAKIVVHDTGIGVRSDVLPYLFERFRQADSSASREHGGLGIGLAIVKHLVELHGGSVSAASEGEGKGATFTVELPLAGVPVMAPAPEPPPETAYTLPEPDEDLIDFDGLEVLAIDDQPDSRAFLTRVLEERRARVINASSAEEGLFVLKQHKPDIVLCDIGMPGVDGYQFIRTMRETGDHTPALAVTAFARPEDRLRALRAGYQGHITKPVNPAELFATIAVFVGQDKS